MTEAQIPEDAAMAPSIPHGADDAIAQVQNRTAQGWRSFVREIIIVVIGVLLALGAQQLVESSNWKSKIQAAEGSIRAELSNDLGLAREQKLLHGCVVAYLDTLQTAVINNDVATIRKLSDMGAPLIGRAWPRTLGRPHLTPKYQTISPQTE